MHGERRDIHELLVRAAGECVGRPVAQLPAEEDVFSDMWRSLGADDVIPGRAARLRTREGGRDVVLSARPARHGRGAFAGARFCVASNPIGKAIHGPAPTGANEAAPLLRGDPA